MPVGLLLLVREDIMVDFYLFERATIIIVNKVHTVAAGRCVAENLFSAEVFQDKVDVLLCVTKIKAQISNLLTRKQQ